MPRRAYSLAQLLNEVNTRWPARPTGKDGWIGDEAHSARTSDHNPDANGVVNAQDLTDWQSLAEIVAEHLRASRDPRVKYVIWRGRMFSSYPTSTCPAWTWRTYSGPNGHFEHVHVSVHGDVDNRSPWGLLDEKDDDMTPTESAQLAAVLQTLTAPIHRELVGSKSPLTLPDMLKRVQQDAYQAKQTAERLSKELAELRAEIAEKESA